jgi:signal transduction histidine kinase
MVVGGIVLNTTFLVREIRRNEQHDAFINAVTHELKTPVASIRLYLETLQTRNVDEQKRKEFYQIMLDDSDRLFATIEQILRTGRVGVSRRLVNFSPVDLDRVIEESLTRARASHHLQPETLTFEKPSNAKVLGDEEELRAAISNLIDNAVKYSGEGARVRVESRREGRYVSVAVKDNGMGIPSGELRRIFRRFYRASGAAARAKGTGLGLFIVRSVAKRHGGNAWAESAGLGQGSTFVLQLPVSRPVYK